MTFNFLQAVQPETQAAAQNAQAAQAAPAENTQAAPAQNAQTTTPSAEQAAAPAQQANATTTEQQPTPDAQQPEQPQGSMMPMIIMLVAMFVIMYFFMIRPQKKRQKQIQEMRSRLGIGDEVILASGIRGKIKDTNPEKSYMTIEISKGVCIDVDRNYVFTDLDQTMQR